MVSLHGADEDVSAAIGEHVPNIILDESPLLSPAKYLIILKILEGTGDYYKTFLFELGNAVNRNHCMFNVKHNTKYYKIDISLEQAIAEGRLMWLSRYNLLTSIVSTSRSWFFIGRIIMSDVPLWAYLLTVIFGGGAIATVIVKIIEVRTAARQKRADNFLHNSQPYIDTLYKPIHKSLSQLEDSYQRYKRSKGFLKSARIGKVTISPAVTQDQTNAKVQSNMSAFRAATEENLHDFYKAYVNLRDLVEEINKDGRDINLPRTFYERLRSFVQFLKIPTDDYWLITSTGKDIEASSVIDKKDFEKRFLTDMRYFKTFISEVSLGTTSGKKAV